MALSANSVFEVRTAGNDTNGGGFVTGASGTDYSQQDAKNTAGSDISTTDAVAVGSTTITSVTANFGTTIVGNIVYFAGGTGSIAGQWRQVTARASTTSITIDASIAASTGMTMNIGGALASLGQAGGVGLVSGNIIYVKSGTYTIASATTNIATGCFASTLSVLNISGYQTTRGDLGTAPLLQASGISTFVIISSTGVESSIANINVDGAGLTSSRGFNARGVVYKCQGVNCTNSAFNTGAGTPAWINCLATGCSTVAAFVAGIGYGSVAYTNTITGFSTTQCFYCLSYNNSGASSDGFASANSGTPFVNNVAYGNGRDGFRITGDQSWLINNVAENNTGTGILLSGVMDGVLLLNNATYNNTGGSINVSTGKGVLNIGAIAGSGSFFTNAASADFSLNNTAGAGASARAAGYPGVLPIGGTGYLDIGALQHQDSGGSSGTAILAGGGLGLVNS